MWSDKSLYAPGLREIMTPTQDWNLTGEGQQENELESITLKCRWLLEGIFLPSVGCIGTIGKHTIKVFSNCTMPQAKTLPYTDTKSPFEYIIVLFSGNTFKNKFCNGLQHFGGILKFCLSVGIVCCEGGVGLHLGHSLSLNIVPGGDGGSSHHHDILISEAGVRLDHLVLAVATSRSQVDAKKQKMIHDGGCCLCKLPIICDSPWFIPPGHCEILIHT